MAGRYLFSENPRLQRNSRRKLCADRSRPLNSELSRPALSFTLAPSCRINNVMYYLEELSSRPWAWPLIVVHVWFIIDAARRDEWTWLWLLLIFPVIGDFAYFFVVMRAAPSATAGFELPGAHKRRRIKELRALIHNLDKPHHYLELGDIYFQKGNLKQAEECYRASLERDPQDIDARAHLGQCLLRLRRPADALPLLEQVYREKPMHDYGHTLMAYAESLAALGRNAAALAAWEQVLENHSYARARVQMAEICVAARQADRARAVLRETVNDDTHAPAFQRRRDRIWIWKAKRLLHTLPKG